MALRAFVQKNLATKGIKRWFFNRMAYNQLGLYRDDIFYETPAVELAISRLPQEVYDARVFRIQRAFQLSLTHSILPKEQWTKFEDDQNNHYLEPYMDEVEREIKERELWVKSN